MVNNNVDLQAVWSREDRDLLITLNTKVDNLSIDVKEMRDGTHLQLMDHEKRIGTIEKEHLAIGGTKAAMERLEKLEEWVNSYKSTWKLIVALASILGGVVGFVLNILSARLGWI